jgi:hypothetical protein
MHSKDIVWNVIWTGVALIYRDKTLYKRRYGFKINCRNFVIMLYKGLFGWTVAVKKVAVGCKLWKKLL